MSKLELSDKHARWLEDIRKIPCEVAAEAGVVSKGENLAFQYGVFLKVRKQSHEGKTYWIEPKGSPLCLFNERCLISPTDTGLIVTEGEIDTLSFLAAGFENVVSVPNGAPGKVSDGPIDPDHDRPFGYLWPEHVQKALKYFTKIVLATDADGPGQNLREELEVRLGPTRCWWVTYPDGCKDANEVLVHYGTRRLQEMIANAKPTVANRLVSFSEIPSRAALRRYSTGWAGLDDHLMIVPPELMIVTGKPNDGKSQWTLALVANLARIHHLPCAILQFEDQPDRNRKDLLTYARSWQHQAINGITEEPAAWVDRMFKTISPAEDRDEDVDFDLPWLIDAIEEAVLRHDCKVVLVDPWNEVEHVWKISETETGYTNQALRTLKRLSRRFKIAVIVVTHPSKVGGMTKSGKDMTLYDISGSAAWKNKADHGVIVWRETTDAVETLIKIDKSKDFNTMGWPGMVKMRFEYERASFSFVEKV